MLTLALIVPLRSIYLESSLDEGVFTESAYRMFCGQVPHRDFHTHFPHLPSLAVLLSFEILGVSVNSFRLVGLLQMYTLGLAVYWTARSWCRPALAFVTAFTFLNSQAVAWPIISHHWSAGIELLGIFFCLQRVLRARNTARFFFAWGVCLGLCLITAQNSFIVGTVLTGGFLVVHRKRLGSPLGIATGFILTVAPYLLTLGYFGALSGYFQDNFAILGAQVQAYHGFESPSQIAQSLSTLAALQGHINWVHAWSFLYSPAALYVFFLAYLAIILARTGLQKGRWDVESAWLLVLATGQGVLLLGYHFKSMYFGFLSPYLILLCLKGCLGGEGAAHRWLTRLTIALALFSNCFSWAVLTTVQDEFIYPIHFNSGILYTYSAKEAKQYDDLQRIVNLASAPQERIFLTPVFQFNHLSALLQRQNACSQLDAFVHLTAGQPHALDQILAEARAFHPPVIVMFLPGVYAPFEEQFVAFNRALLATDSYVPVLLTDTWIAYVVRDRLDRLK